MKKKYIVLFFILLTIHFILPRIMKADPFVFLSSDGTEVASYTEEEILKYLTNGAQPTETVKRYAIMEAVFELSFRYFYRKFRI